MPNALFAGVREYLAQKEREGHVCRVVYEPEPEEALPTEAPDPQTGVTCVEGTRLQARFSGFRTPEDTATSEFRYFLDGIQFSHLIGFVDNVPLVHHLSAAAILCRDPETRELGVWRWSGAQECLLIPFAHLAPEPLERLGVPLGDTTDKSPDAPLESVALRALAHSKSQRLRRELEVAMIAEWLASGAEGWLMVDGPLMLLPELRPRGRMVGVVKSFGAQFFAGEEQNSLISLQPGWRTTAFLLPRGARPAADSDATRRYYSWYVRLREHQGRDADFGLVRLETPPESELLEAADEISRWVIAERSPLSTPDPRWDNLLYPIRACERYLKSSLPERNRVHLQL